MKLKEFMAMVQESAGLVAGSRSPFEPEKQEKLIACQVKTGPDGEVVEAMLNFSIRAAR